MDYVSYSVSFAVSGFVGSLIVYLAYNSVYGGSRVNLAEAQLGKVYNFVYEQPLHGEPERFLAKVEKVYVFSEKDLRGLNSRSRYRRHDESFERSKTLITARTYDGRVRNFYAERCRDVRKPLLGGRLFTMPKVAAFLL